MSNIETYIKALSAADSALEIVTDSTACAAYIEKNYSRIPASAPKAILYPTTAEQVEQIVKAANEQKVSLVVRSSQGNETYHGSSVPTEGSECVAVNLSKMTKIMHVDAKNNMAIIEPGVTYAQLNEALKPYGCYVEHPLMPRNEKSVIASLLDRDPVMTPKHCWDIPDPLTCVEMVMGNGCVFRTGSAAGPGTLEEMLESGCAINQPQGPYCLDLARVISGSQGTLAIVTWASVKIRPIGSVDELVYIQTDDIDSLTACEEQIIRRRLGENTFIVNAKALEQLTGKAADTAKWILITDVRGNRYFPMRYVENQIADMEDIAKGFGLTITKEIAGLSNETIASVINDTSKTGDYWHDRSGKEHLDLFFLSTLDRVSIYSKLAETAVEKHGLKKEDLSIYVQPCMMGRNCHIEFLIPADKDTIGKLEMCLGTVCLDNRAFYSRPYGAMTEKVYEKSASQTPFMAHIKHFLDENRIMNPGKLVYDGGRN